MPNKYEKFEEWMLHAPVVTSNGDCGKIVQSVGEGRVAVLLDRGVEILSRVWNLEFIEVGSTRSSPISWEVGQVVWDLLEGRGVITRITNNANPVRIEFDSGEVINVYPDGSHYYGVRTVFFSEPTIIADTMPPKKSFVPTLKEGEKILLKVPYLEEEKVVFVRKEEENILYYMFEDGTKDYSGKSQITVTRIGEEIKWEN